MSNPDYIPFAGPGLDDREIAAVTGVLRRGWISTGPEAGQFETELAELTGRRYAVALNSCTAALHLAFVALGMGPGAEVIVPTVTFTATAAAVIHAGGTPVLADVSDDTLNISPDAVRSALTPRTRAVVAVHFAGRVADTAEISRAIEGTGAALVEDAAHTLPAYRDGRIAGSLGDLAVFSFFATKPITTGEGGMLVCDDPAIEATVRVHSLHGISRQAAGRYAPGGSAHYDVTVPGFKYNLSDLQAAIGRVQLAKHRELWEKRRAVAAVYLRCLADVEQLELPLNDTAADLSSWYLFVIRLRLEMLTIDRDRFCAELHENGIGTSVHFRPLHTYTYYRDHLASAAGSFPVADHAFPRLVSLPLNARMSEEDALHVVDVVKAVCTRFKR
jgi:dTDP-4-amino-4,6-dideoxygalactose transaminase